MAALFPQVNKLKGDIELIEDMLFLVEDTYLNLDNAGKSLLLLFDHSFTHPQAEKMQKQFVQLLLKENGTAAPPQTRKCKNNLCSYY